MDKVFCSGVEVNVEAGTAVVSEVSYEGRAEGCLIVSVSVIFVFLDCE